VIQHERDVEQILAVAIVSSNRLITSDSSSVNACASVVPDRHGRGLRAVAATKLFTYVYSLS